jgi:hypothetical protein
VRSEDFDRVNLRVSQELLIVGIILPGFPLGHSRFSNLLAGVAHCKHLATRMIEVAQDIEIRDAAAANNAEANLIHRFPLPPA